MKKFTLLILSLFSISVFALGDTISVQQEKVSLNVEASIEQLNKKLEQQNNACAAQFKKLQNNVFILEAYNKSLAESNSQLQKRFDSLSNIVAINSSNIKTTADTLGIKIQDTTKHVSKNSDTLKSTAIFGIIAIIIVLLISIMIAVILYNKGKKSSDDKIALLKKQADHLNEKVIEKLSTESETLQHIVEKLNTSVSASIEPDHSLVKTLADRITFMEMTLYKMDNTVKGYKQLTKSISQMKDNLLANGYELVPMLGKEYNDGMKVTANFIEDENVESGKQIITGIIKPQINYKGVMIQSAQITVSQN